MGAQLDPRRSRWLSEQQQLNHHGHDVAKDEPISHVMAKLELMIAFSSMTAKTCAAAWSRS